MSKFGGGIGAPSKEERLKEAADIHLRLGQIQRYCELMVELGQVRSTWLHNMAVAVGAHHSHRCLCLLVGESVVRGPGSVHEVLEETRAKVRSLLSGSGVVRSSFPFRYWEKKKHVVVMVTMCRRADQLMAEDNDEAVPYCVATGETRKLVAFFRGRGQLLEALIIAQVSIAPTQTAGISKRLKTKYKGLSSFRERAKGTSARPKARRSTPQPTTWTAGNNTRGSAERIQKKTSRGVGAAVCF